MRRLSPALLTMGMLGVVGLLVAAYVGKRLLAREEGPPQDPIVNVPMALTDLTPGTRITEAHVAMGRSKESKVTRDVVRTSRVLVGRVVKNAITAAQPISTLDLYPPGVDAPLNMESPDNRAVVVPLGSATAATVGQYVDVHFTPSSDPDANVTGGQILTLFKGVKILQMSGSSSGGRSQTVTLELTREQANIILLAKDRGTLNLVYTPEGKGTGGVAVNDADRATLYQILGYNPKPAPEPEKPFQTELFSGSGRRVHTFRDGMRADDYGGFGGGAGDGVPGNDPRDPRSFIPNQHNPNSTNTIQGPSANMEAAEARN